MRLPFVIIMKAVELLGDVLELLLFHDPLLDVPEGCERLEPVPLPLALEDAGGLVVAEQGVA